MAATLADDTSLCKFVNENILISITVSLKFVPKGPINNSSIGSDNGLAPSRRNAIIWTHDGIVYRRIYASLDLHELTNVIMNISCMWHLHDKN